MREVPAQIARPDYVGRIRADRDGAPEVKDADTIERMRVAGRLAAQAMVEVARHIQPGVTTDELDRVGHEFLCDHGAYPSTLGYPGSGRGPAFPKSLCTSVNEVICHGIPDSTVLQDGDIVNIDVTAFRDGVHGDTDATYLVGDVDEESRLLVERTRAAMLRGVHAVEPGRTLNVIGRVIESYADGSGTGWCATSPDMASAPLSTRAWSSRTTTIRRRRRCSRSGMAVHHRADAQSGHARVANVGRRLDGPHRDGRRSAQFEHTVLVTDSGVEILTRQPGAWS